MKKVFGLFFLLSACAGGFSGSGGSGLPGSVGGEGLPQGVEVAAATGSDGVLGSQSSSSDIATKFVRDHALDFDGETETIHEILIERPKLGPSQAFGKASIRKIPTSKTLQMVAVQDLEVSAIQALNQEVWVRAIGCGNFPDAEIEPLIPPEDQSKPWAQDKLLWLVLNLPRSDKPGIVECQSPSYRDFPVSTESKVDLTALAGEPQDLFFFVRVSSADWSKGGELALDAAKPLSDEQWLELSKKLKLRIVRLLPHGNTIRIHPIPAYHLSPN
ncbi:MAG TPA: hypothetical protein VJR29_02960 [bacterium]|nr:hypothetical protein [bacterium]